MLMFQKNKMKLYKKQLAVIGVNRH